MITRINTPAAAAQFHIEEIMEVIGGGVKINSLIDSSDADMPFIGFRVKKGTKTHDVWVLRDPEGNGSGHLSIETA